MIPRWELNMLLFHEHLYLFNSLVKKRKMSNKSRLDVHVKKQQTVEF
jgi:hypothetical protein